MYYRFAKDQDEFFRQYALSFRKMLELTAAPLDATSYTLSVAVHAHLFDEGYHPGRKPNGTVTGSVSPSATSKTNSAHLVHRYTASLALASAVAGLFFLWS